jgi:hypothetical protein
MAGTSESRGGSRKKPRRTAPINEAPRKIQTGAHLVGHPIKINYDALSDTEKKNWINISGEKQDGDITRIRPNFTADSHLVCYYNPQDHLYDICRVVSTGG